MPGRPQCADQSCIEHDESDERSGSTEDQETERLVKYVVDTAVPERRSHRYHLHFSSTDVLMSHCFHFEKHRQVVDKRAGDDNENGPPCTESTSKALVARPAYSGVAVSGDQDDRPHGDGVCDGRQRPDVRFQTRVEATDSLRQPVGVVVHGSERLDKETLPLLSFPSPSGSPTLNPTRVLGSNMTHGGRHFG